MSVDLFPTWVLGSVDLTEYPFSVDRDNTVDIGEPEMVVETLASQLADGDLEREVRYGNRAYVIPIYVEGPTLADVADAEALLRAQLRRDGLTLKHNPGDSWAVDSVYEVQTARMTPVRDDRHESHLIRKFTLTLTCLPFARSADAVTVPALTVGGTPVTVTVNTADSTTGWSTSSPATVGQTGGYVYAGQTSAAFGEAVHYLFFAAATVPATPYVVVEWQATYPTLFTPTLLAAPVVQTLNLTDGWTRTVYDTTGFSYASLPFRAVLLGTGGQYRIRDIKRTDTIPQITTRQIARIVSVLGTERTPASLAIASSDGTTNLGMTIVHTSPEDGSGYSPPLRRWRVSGAASPTTDTTTMSGKREPILIANPFIAEVPNATIPEGGYLLAARMRVSSAGTAVINWGAETIIDGTGDGNVGDYATIDFPNTAWFFVPIAVVTLPTVRSYSGAVRILMSSTTAELDEAWLFRADDGCALTVVHNVTKPRMWLDSPGVTSQVPRIWVGDDAGRADASHPGANLLTHGNHTFTPDATATFVGTSGTENPEAALTYYPRWHSNAAS